MKNLGKVASLFVFLLFVTGLGVFVSATSGDSPVSSFEVDILGPQSPPPTVVSVQVPDYIYFGNLSVGQQTDDFRVDINNTGNVAVTVIPQLVDESDVVFNSTFFKRITSEPYYHIGEYRHNISAPTSGGVKSSYMYAKLDLRDYDAIFPYDSINRIKANVRFVAVAQ